MANKKCNSYVQHFVLTLACASTVTLFLNTMIMSRALKLMAAKDF